VPPSVTIWQAAAPDESLAFLLVVLFSPDGILGLWNRFATKLRFRRPARLERLDHIGAD